MEKIVLKGYNHFWNAIDTLPNYMQNNLKEMPNNKGYRWKDVVFYGELPLEETQPTIIFEKINNELIIHEYHLDGSYVKNIKNYQNKKQNINQKNVKQKISLLKHKQQKENENIKTIDKSITKPKDKTNFKNRNRNKNNKEQHQNHQNKPKQNKAKQNKPKQNKAKQNNQKQTKTNQNKPKRLLQVNKS
jgi:hypothetical protein